VQKLLPIMVVLALSGCATPQDQVLKKIPGAQASEQRNCSLQTTNRTIGSTTALVCN